MGRPSDRLTYARQPKRVADACRPRAWGLLFVALVAGLVCTSLPAAVDSASLAQRRRAVTAVDGLHVSGNQILNGAGQAVRLRGVNYPSFEYACIQGWGLYSGQTDLQAVQAMLAWSINVVRIPLNSHC